MNSDALSILSTYLDEETLNTLLVVGPTVEMNAVNSNQDFWYRRATQIVRDNLKNDQVQLQLRAGSDWKTASSALEAAFKMTMPFLYPQLEITSTLVLYELGYGRSRHEKDQALLNACVRGDVASVKFLLSVGADPLSGPCLLEAVARNHTEVALLLLSDPRMDSYKSPRDTNPDTLGYTTLHHAVRWCNLVLVRALLEHKEGTSIIETDAQGDNSLDLGLDLFAHLAKLEESGTSTEPDLSVSLDTLEGILVLLVQNLVEEGVRSSDVFDLVKHAGNHSAAVTDELVALLSDSPLSFTDELEELSALGYHFAVRAILEQCVCDPKRDDSKCLRVACEKGHTQTVEFLLEDGRADPRVDQGICLEEAAARGHVGVVTALLADGRVNPRVNHNSALRAAEEGGHITVAALIKKWRSQKSMSRRV